MLVLCLVLSSRPDFLKRYLTSGSRCSKFGIVLSAVALNFVYLNARAKHGWYGPDRVLGDEITKVGSRLIPDGFIGDRREVQDCLSKVSYILTVLGEKSAKAQGLQKVITSGEKLRNSDHVVYILIDPKGGSRGFGTVVGMLKIGIKHLYVFDAGGNNHEVTTKCVLDFYVHESKQRMGLGKMLFQHMLREERLDPVHLAIDKPSSKFLSFLLKHYGLQKVIPQMNNFVVFEGFFNNRHFGESGGKEKKLAAGVSSVGGLYSSGTAGFNLSSSPRAHQYQSISSVNLNNSSYYGRQAPHKPISTMGMILQQKPAPSQQPPQNVSDTEEKDMETEIPTPRIENVNNLQRKDENEKESTEAVPPAEPALQMQQTEPQETPAIISNTPTHPLETPDPETPNDKTRLGTQGHLDLKFFHSSLW